MESDNFPIVLKNDNIMGRYYAASRRIQPGELILQDDPIILCPNAPVEESEIVCLGCCGVTQKSQSISCYNCGWPMCKKECADIPDHANFECKIFTKENIKPPLSSPYSFIADAEYIKVLRCLLLKELGKEDEKMQERWNLIQDFEAHVDLRKGNPKILFMSKLIRKFIQDLCKLTQFDDATIDFVLGAVDVNAFRNVTNPIVQNGKVGACTFEKNATVLFSKGAMVAHGCKRNTQSLTLPNGKLEMRAGAVIEPDEPITHAYVDLMIGTPERRKILREQFYFDCTCLRCRDPTELSTYFSALKCQQCKKGFLLMDNPLDSSPYWTCNNTSECGEVQTTEYEVELLEELRKEEMKILRSGRKTNVQIQNWIELLEKYYDRFHENHYALLQIQLHLMRCVAKVVKPPPALVEDVQGMIMKYKKLYYTFYPNVGNNNGPATPIMSEAESG